MIFANPTYLYLLLLLIPMIGWYVYKLSKNQASLQVSSTEGFDAPGASSWKVWLRHVPFIFAYGGGSCPRRDIGASAVDQQLAELFDGRYRHRAGNGYLDQYDGAGLETEPSGSIQRCGVRFHQRPSER